MTLTQTAKAFRLFVKVFGVVFVGFLIIRMGIFVYLILFPPPPVEPVDSSYEAAFGKLPPLELQLASVEFTPNYTIKLDLVILPNLPTQPEVAMVYPVLKAPYGFLSEDRAQQIATVFNMTSEPIELNALENVWRAPNQILTINTQTLNFRYEYKYDLDPSVFKEGFFRSHSAIIDKANSYKNSYNIFGEYADDLSQGKPELFFLKYHNSKLQPVQSSSEAESVRVDFKRRDISITDVSGRNISYQFVSPNYVGSNSHLMFGIDPFDEYMLIDVQHTLWRYSEKQGSTYPIMPSSLAWEVIQSNPQLFTIYIGNQELGPLDRNISTPEVSDLNVKYVDFVYYDPSGEQDYIQPVWMFRGDASLSTEGVLDWVGYVPAVRPDHIDSELVTTPTPVLDTSDSSGATFTN